MQQAQSGGKTGFHTIAQTTARAPGGKLVPAAVYCLAAIVGSLGVVGKIPPIRLLSPTLGAFGMGIVLFWLMAPLFFRYALRFRVVLGSMAGVGLILFPLIIFPRVQRMHAVGRGSDQPDCIIVVSNGLAHAQWPYDSARVWSHNPLSCGPGWVGLHLPLVQTLGYGAALVILFAASLLALRHAIGTRSTLGFLALLALIPSVWIAAADGTDFLTFGLLAAAIFAWQPRKRSLLFSLLLSVVAQFRIATLLLPMVLIRKTGRASAWLASVIAVAVEAGFLFANPVKFIGEGPMHLFFKLTGAHLPQFSPLILSILFVSVTLICCYVASLLFARWPAASVLPMYLGVIFVAPALLGFRSSFRQYGFGATALGYWEGGNWMVGCLPLLALLLVMRHDVGSSTEASMSPTDAAGSLASSSMRATL